MIAITEREFSQLSEYIQKHCGIHLKDEKQTLVIGRLHKVVADLGYNTFSEYYQHLINDKTEESLLVLIDKITTNHTFFMREPEHFYYFRDTILPYLKETVHDRDLRIWCAASSSGEEPYTLAMIIDEFFSQDKLWWNTKLLATDLSIGILEQAKAGLYDSKKISPLPKSWVQKYFKKHDADNYIVTQALKNEVIYRKFNLMEPNFPFKKQFHVIFCRNVMIYFDNPTKEALVNKFYDFLVPGGYLIIGHSESLNREKTKLQYIKPAVYRKTH